jgi:hypothetical protein
MQLYHYHPETREYLGESEARPDPLVPGGWLIPAHATTQAPPAAPQGLAAAWSGAAWTLAEDHRGRQGWVDGQPATVTELGPLPDGWSDTAPEPTPDELLDAAIRELEAVYQSKYDALDKLLLAALHTGGPNEAASRQAISAQRLALIEEFNVDLLNLLT